MSNFFSVTVDNNLAIIKLTRPEKKNALNGEMYIGLANALNKISDRNDVTITVITGSGDFYSSGNDLTGNLSENYEQMIEDGNVRVRKLVEAFINHSKILLALVNGPAIGIAATTLLLCDIVYCTPDAYFLTPFSRYGFCPEGCSSYTFPKVLGVSKANEMLLLNKKLTAIEALNCGFVGQIISKEALEGSIWTTIKDYAMNINKKTLMATKKLLRRCEEDKLHEVNRNEMNQLKQLLLSPEMKEMFSGMRAMLKNTRSKI